MMRRTFQTYRILLFPAIVIGILMLHSCVEEFVPEIDVSTKLLVVEGQITNDTKQNFIKLSYSFSDTKLGAENISGALVSYQDEYNNLQYLEESEPGRYEVQNPVFTPEVGKSYKLHVVTEKGHQYQSDFLLLRAPGSIDTITYQRDEVFNETGRHQVLQYYISSEELPSGIEYLRWSIDEVWEYRSNYTWVYDHNYVLTASGKPSVCWKQSKGGSRLLYQSFEAMESPVVKDKALFYVDPAGNERYTWEHIAIIHQYSISKEEYDFWKTLEESSQAEGTIFDKQPYALNSNIYGMTDDAVPVSGFISVAGIASKSITITSQDLSFLGLGKGTASCTSFQEETPEVYDSISKRELYDNMIAGGWYCVSVVYTNLSVELGLGFALPECVDCSLTADSIKPEIKY